MSRIATWRRGPNDPTTARGWLVRGGGTPDPGVLPSKPDRRQRTFYIVYGTAYLLSGIALFALHVRYAGGLLILGQLPFTIHSICSSAKRKPLPIVGEGPGESLWVTMTVKNRLGFQTGRDRGWLIHSEGWLLFEGARTSFAFTRGEARQPRSEWMGNLRLEDGRMVAFALTEVTAVSKSLEAIVRDWETAPIPEGEAVLPPMETHPVVWADRWTGWMLGAVVAGVVAGFGLGFETWSVVALAGSVVLACLVGAAVCARQLRAGVLRAFPAPSPSPVPETFTRAQGHPATTERLPNASE